MGILKVKNQIPVSTVQKSDPILPSSMYNRFAMRHQKWLSASTGKADSWISRFLAGLPVKKRHLLMK